MSGKCYKCWKGFGMINKQVGCTNCGYAFCKKCITKSMSVPKLKNKNGIVCDRCFDLISGKVDPKNSEQLDPPQALFKRLEAAKLAEEKHTQKLNDRKNKKELKDRDDALLERLAKLKDVQSHTISAPTEDEMMARLQALKGVQNDDSKKPVIQPKKISADEVEDLLNEVSEELAIGRCYQQSDDLDLLQEPKNPEELIRNTQLEISKESSKKKVEDSKNSEISSRLEELKKFNLESKSIQPARPNDKVVKDSTSAGRPVDNIQQLKKKWKEREDEELKELPWCCICTNDADMRCDDELYCMTCYKKYKPYLDSDDCTCVPIVKQK